MSWLGQRSKVAAVLFLAFLEPKRSTWSVLLLHTGKIYRACFLLRKEVRMVRIDEEKCIGCGLCVKDCLRKSIHVSGGKAIFTNYYCIECGHCYAVCPQKAITIDTFPEESYEYTAEDVAVDEEKLLNLFRWRRSVRQFSKKKIEAEKIDKLLEAGRYAPTARNYQEISFVAVSDRVDAFRKLLMDKFEQDVKERFMTVREDEAFAASMENYRRYKKSIDRYREDPVDENDFITFGATAIWAVIVDTDIFDAPMTLLDAGLACANVEHLANAMGLGVLHCGIGAAVSEDEEIRTFLGLKKNEKLVFTIMMGYPSEQLRYLRTPQRKNTGRKL